MIKKLFFVSYLLVLIGCVSEPIPGSYDLRCSSLDGLKVHALFLHVEKPQASYSGKIYLPKFPKTDTRFCGFWEQDELTKKRLHQFHGLKNSPSDIFISLNPEIVDAGYILILKDARGWLTNGVLGSDSIAGIFPRGIFKIESI